MSGPVRMLLAGFVATLGSIAIAGPAVAATISSSTATPLVDNFADDADCSLREMIEIANTNTAAVENACTVMGTLGDDEITLGTGTYAMNTVGAEDASPDDNAQGDLDIGGAGGLTIDGTGPATTRISETTGVPSTRVMEVFGALDLTDLTVSSGAADAPADESDGGGIRFASSTALDLTNVDMSSNVTGSGGDGGAIAATSTGGTVNVTDGQIFTNTAANAGGGISALGNLHVSDSSISTNTANSFGGGIRKDGFAFSFTDSSLIDNHVTGGNGNGGGLELEDDVATTASITRAHIAENDTVKEGGGIYSATFPGSTLAIEDTTIEDNEATSSTISVQGGGLRLVNGTTTLDSSVVASNEASHTGGVADGSGGGIYVGTFAVGGITLRATDSVISDNTASTTQNVGETSGGGIYAADAVVEVRRATVSGNTLTGPTAGGNQTGAGINIGPNQGTLLLLNSTVSNNVANATFGRGGGVYITDGPTGTTTTMQSIHSTFVANRAGDLGGVADPGDAITEELTPSVTIRGSILTSATPTEVCATDGGAGFTSGNFNVANGTTCGLAMGSDLQNAIPNVQTLGFNGGPFAGAPGFTFPIQTNELPAGSVGSDQVPAASCLNEVGAPLTTDERGFSRPSPAGGSCDAGSFEAFVASTPPPTTNPPPGTTSTPAPAKKCKKGQKLKKGKCVKKKRKKKR